MFFYYICAMKKYPLLIALSVLLASCGGGRHSEVQISDESELPGHSVVTLAGSCYDIDLSPREDIKLVRVNTAADALQSLVNRKAQVLVCDEITYNSTVLRENGVKIACLGKAEFPTAFMFRKGDVALASACTSTIEGMEADGSMEELKDYWLTERYLESGKFRTVPQEGTGEPIKVACAADMAPIAFPVEGEWYGLEVDILRRMANELGRKIEFTFYPPTSAVIALPTGLADVLLGAIFMTPEREEENLFSKPYHNYHPAYFVLDPEAAGEGAGFWEGLKKGLHKTFIVENRWKYITKGLGETVKITLLSILFGAVLGAGLSAMMRSRRKWLRCVAGAYNWLIAGIPMLVLLLILFYIVFAGTGLDVSTVAIIAFAMNFASGAADVYNTSLDAIPSTQTEGGLALGFTKVQTFRHIILPQALRRGLPLFQAQCISLLKATSIVGYISLEDITRAGDIIRSRTFDAVMPLLVVTVVYFILAWAIGLLLKFALPKKSVL